MNASKTTLLIAACAAATFAGSIDAAPVVYEPFAYTPGVINGTQNTGTGLGAWTGSGTGNPFAVVGTGLTFTGLTTSGGAVRRPAVQQAAEMSAVLSSGAQTALLADNTTIWFSVLLDDYNANSANLDLNLTIGNAAYDNDGTPSTGQNGFGVAITGGNGIGGVSLINGVETFPGADGLSTDGDSKTTYMIAGKITWGAFGAADDTLLLFNITDTSAAEPLDGTAFATVTGDFDQTGSVAAANKFDTLSISDRQIGTLDEIRFGNTAADVGVGPVPEPGSLALLGLGGLLIARRRRD